MSTSQEVKDFADSVAFAKAQLLIQTPLFEAKNAAVDALVTTELADLEAAQLAYDNAVEAARITVGWQTIADAYNDAVATVSNSVAALTAAAEEYDGF